MRELGHSTQSLHSISVQNLEQKASTGGKVMSVGQGISMIVELEGLESSLVFAPRARTRFGMLDSALVYGIPSRDTFIYCEASDRAAIAQMRKTVQTVFNDAEATHQVTDKLLKLSGSASIKYADGEGIIQSFASLFFGRS
jgi:hypothetical protein